MKNTTALFLVLLLLFFGVSSALHATLEVPAKKQTELGLYVTAQEAYAKWQAAPDSVKILDVRTPGEYIFVGHAPMATNIPLKFLSTSFDVQHMKPKMPMNENFIAEVEKIFEKDDIILVMCRSGGRSAVCANILAKAGFKHVYNIIDGFEGDTLNSAGSYNNGKRILNGWKNSGVPWTYNLDPALVYNR